MTRLFASARKSGTSAQQLARPILPPGQQTRRSSLAACSCRASVFYDPDQPAAACWNCGHVPPGPLLLELPGGSVVLSEGGVIAAHHLRRDRDYDTVVARPSRRIRPERAR